MRRITVLVATLALGFALAPAAQAANKFTVTSKLEKGSIELGDQQRVTGSVSPKSPGKTVKIYVHYASDSSGEYHYVGKKTLSSKSTFSQSFTPQDSGATTVQVVKAASGSRKAGSSKKTFKNYGTFRLQNFPRVVEDGVVSFDDELTYREDYADLEGYRFQLGGRARWTLNGKCKSVTSYVGVPDTAGADTTAQGILSAETHGGTTLADVDTGVLYWDEVPKIVTTKLYKKSGAKYTFAKYLRIYSQVQGTSSPAFATAATDLLCNLPGGAPADLG